MTAGSNRCLLDTNILLYAALGRSSEPQKWATCRKIVATEDYVTSAQVLAEFYSNAIKGEVDGKTWVPLTPAIARRWVMTLTKKPFQPITAQIVLAGIDISQRHEISYWNGAIIAAAEALDARTVYSEDLNHGQTFGQVTVVNPFL
ncbi:MAG: PIN domain-containing protein [Pseudomonadota bacterium]